MGNIIDAASVIESETDKRVREALGIGKADDPNRVYHARDPRLPQFEFEWHPRRQKVYRIDLPGEWRDGEFVHAGRVGQTVSASCVAEHCLTHGMFLGFVQTFCRGYLLTFSGPHKRSLGAVLPDLIKEHDSCPTNK